MSGHTIGLPCAAVRSDNGSWDGCSAKSLPTFGLSHQLTMAMNV